MSIEIIIDRVFGVCSIRVVRVLGSVLEIRDLDLVFLFLSFYYGKF